jgi:ADP-ribosylglycohydrolase
MSDYYKAALFGVAVGDALGVPVEFESRQTIAQKPVTDMIGFGTYDLPPGTWSDDSSLTFCLADALIHDYDLNRIGQTFIDWRYKNLWTARGEVFDVGITTQRAIDRLKQGTRADLAGDFEISSNGNGALMRILPLLFYIMDKPIEERFEITRKVSAITHGHIRSAIACFYYLEFALKLLHQKDLRAIYEELQSGVGAYLKSAEINSAEITVFDRLLKYKIAELDVADIQSTGYVVHTLEASIWCLMATSNYKDAVLKAVNLGNDTDTTAAVTGGLAALYYGYESIPEKWLIKLARMKDIEYLALRLKHTFD